MISKVCLFLNNKEMVFDVVVLSSNHKAKGGGPRLEMLGRVYELTRGSHLFWIVQHELQGCICLNITWVCLLNY